MGGVDLMFTNLPPSVAVDVGCNDVVSFACFEVKSMHGDFRKFFNQRSRKIGDSHETTPTGAGVPALGRAGTRRYSRRYSDRSAATRESRSRHRDG